MLFKKKKPKDPVRPATPVRPVTPIEPIREDHLLKPIEPFDTLPLSIPRIDICKNGGASRTSNSPRSVYSHNEQISPRSAVSMGNSSKSGRSGPISPRSAISSSSSQNAQIPMKKIIRKSRWVSIHDGRPVTPFVETVTYEPKYSYNSYRGRRSATPTDILRSRQTINDERGRQRYLNNSGCKHVPELHCTPEYSFRPELHYINECADIIENPLYRD